MAGSIVVTNHRSALYELSRLGRRPLVHAYVINLARSTERRAHIAAELGKFGIDYEIVEGVDGRDLDMHDPRTIDPSVLKSDWFRPGTALNFREIRPISGDLTA